MRYLIEPHIIAVSEGHKHVHVVGGLVHAGGGLHKVGWTGAPKASGAGALHKLAVGRQTAHHQRRQLGVDDALPQRCILGGDVAGKRKDGQALGHRAAFIAVARIVVAAHQHGHLPQHRGCRGVFGSDRQPLAANHLFELVRGQLLGQGVGDFGRDDELFGVHGLQPKDGLERRVDDADALRCEQGGHHVDDGGFAGVGVADDERHDVKAVKAAHRVEQAADEAEQVGIDDVGVCGVASVELIAHQAVEQGCLGVVEVTDLVDVVARHGAVIEAAVGLDVAGDEVEDTVAKSQVGAVAAHEGKAAVIDAGHVDHQVVEAPWEGLELRMIGETLGQKGVVGGEGVVDRDIGADALEHHPLVACQVLLGGGGEQPIHEVADAVRAGAFEVEEQRTQAFAHVAAQQTFAVAEAIEHDGIAMHIDAAVALAGVLRLGDDATLAGGGHQGITVV